MTLYLSWEQIAIRIALACIASLAIRYNRVRRTILLSRAYLTFDGGLEGNPHFANGPRRLVPSVLHGECDAY
jgi:hypothetical protein